MAWRVIRTGRVIRECTNCPHILLTKFIRLLSLEMTFQENVSQSFMVTFLKKEKLHPYKFQLIHELSEDHPDKRLEFVKTF